MSSATPIRLLTSCGVMPIFNFANLLLGAGVPTISPSKVPSIDLTVRAPGVEDCVLAAAGAGASDCFADCWPAQPITSTDAMSNADTLIFPVIGYPFFNGRR